MDDALKQRLVGATVLAVFAVLIVPWLLGKPAPAERERGHPRPVHKPLMVAPLTPPLPIQQASETAKRELPVTPTMPLTASQAPVQRAPVKPQAKAIGNGWFVQLAAFSSDANAQKLTRQLGKFGQSSEVRVDGAYWLVFAGPFKSQADASKARSALERRTGLRGVVRAPAG